MLKKLWRNVWKFVVVVVVAVAFVSGPRQQIAEAKSKSSAWLAHFNSIFPCLYKKRECAENTSNEYITSIITKTLLSISGTIY